MINQTLHDTLGNLPWFKQHAMQIKALFPETWTHVDNLNIPQIGFNFKLMGMNWRSNDEFVTIILFLTKLGMLQRDGYLTRANPRFIV